MAEQIIVLDNSINSRLLWPDSMKPANNAYALKVIQQAAKGRSFMYRQSGIINWLRSPIR